MSTHVLTPKVGNCFPSFAFTPQADGKVTVTHHYLDVARDNENRKVLRRRTDRLEMLTARQLYGALKNIGFH